MKAEFHTLCCISEYIISCIQLLSLGMLKDCGTGKIVCGTLEMRAVTSALTTVPLTENCSCPSLATREAFPHCELSPVLFTHTKHFWL